MAYAIRYRKRARTALDNCRGIYGASLAGPIHKWLSQLAAEAQGRTSTISFDAKTLLETVANHPDLDKWASAGRRWLDAQRPMN